MRKWQVKRGDTLVEVMFSVAIFGLVAIGVVSLMNSSLATTQSSLENTMVRTEIDAQAEALRFIHDAYASQRNLDTKSQQYKNIWEKITRTYVTKPENVPSFDFTSCDIAYDPDNAQSLFKTYSFAINTRKLDPTTVASAGTNVDSIIVPAKSGASTYNTNIFTVPSLYPRIIYTGSGSGNSETDFLEKFSDGGTVYTKANLVEGLWVIAVCGDNTDNCNSSNSSEKQPSYYDFYIRSCWYAPGKNTATTLGTIIRLYNPNVEVTHYTETTFSLSYDANGGTANLPEPKVVSGVGQYTFDVTKEIPTKEDADGNTVTFLGWCTGKIDATGGCNGDLIQSGTSVTATTSAGKDILLTASYGYRFSLTYDKNTTDSVTKMPSPNPHTDTCVTPTCSITFNFSSSQPLRNGYVFMGWSEDRNATNPTYTAGTENVTMNFTAANNNRTVYAVWYKTTNSEWTISLFWDNNGPSDLDSRLLVGGTEFRVWPSSDRSGTANGIKVSIDHDNTTNGGNGTDPEITSLDGVGTETVYFWAYNWSGEKDIGDSPIRAIISSKSGEFANITAPLSDSDGRYWNVCKISNGKIYVRNTITSSPEKSY